MRRVLNRGSSLLVLGLCFMVQDAWAVKLPLPASGNDIAGKVQFARVEEGDTFATIAQRYDVGFYELVESNPEVNPDGPKPDTILIVPTRYILPHVPREGIVINLASMRLYYFPKGKKYFYTYPVGIGKQNWSSPLGELHIIQKIKNPIWIVPKSILKYRKEHGDPLPKKVLSGPDNPLGYFAMRLSDPTYLIHGTDDPSSVGRRSSAGCIHLYPEDIKALFSITRVGERVLMINQPYKVGWENHQLYVEAHLPLEEQRDELSNTSAVVVALINSMVGDGLDSTIDWQKANQIIKEHMGIPTVVSRVPASPY